MNELKITLPEYPSSKLKDLKKGDCFIFEKDAHLKICHAYLVTKNEYIGNIEAVNLLTGDIHKYVGTHKVLLLEVEFNCKIYDVNKLPF